MNVAQSSSSEGGVRMDTFFFEAMENPEKPGYLGDDKFSVWVDGPFDPGTHLP